MILALAAMAIACEKPEPQVTPAITLSSEAEVTVPTDGAISNVAFNANVAWTASIDNAQWQLSAKSGEAGDATIKVTAPQNTTNDAIVATLTIKAETASQTVKFTQLQKNALILPETEKEIDCNEQDFYIDVQANIAYEAVPASDCPWIVVSTPVTKSMVDYQTHVHVDVNSGEAREGTIVFKGEGVTPIEYTVKQAAFEPYFNVKSTDENGYLYAPVEGGTLYLQIQTNLEYTYKTYEDGAFPWQHVTVEEQEDGSNIFTVVIDANETYDERTSYIKFIIPYIQDDVLDEAGNPTGETKDHTEYVYVAQDGLDCIKYSISMYDSQFDTWGTTVISEAIYNGKHYVSNGQDLYEINPADGTYQKIAWPWGAGMTQRVITNDDAGNLIVCNHTAYIDESYTDGYFILNVVTPAGNESNLITKAAWECGGPFGAKLVVRGDITSDALICAPVEGIVDIKGGNEIGCWEVSSGVLGEYKRITVTGPVCIGWLAGYWCAYPANCPQFIPQGVHISDGFLMSGCYEENAAYAVDGTSGAAVKMLTPELYVDPYEMSGNFGFQSVSMAVVGGKAYLAVLASPFFPDYGPGWYGNPYLFILEIPATLPSSPLNIWESANLVKACTTYFPWDADPATDWGINVFADIKMYDANGKIGVVLTDLNGRSIECYEFDPAIIKK